MGLWGRWTGYRRPSTDREMAADDANKKRDVVLMIGFDPLNVSVGTEGQRRREVDEYGGVARSGLGRRRWRPFALRVHSERVMGVMLALCF